MFSIIFSSTDNIPTLGYGIGYKNSIPWHCPEDLKFFKNITTYNSEPYNNVVIMGRKTYESLSGNLAKRVNIVVSSTLQPTDGITVFKTLDESLKYAYSLKGRRYIFVIGGKNLIEEGLRRDDLECVYHNIITPIDEDEIITLDTYVKIPYNTLFKDNKKTECYDALTERYHISFEKIYRNIEDNKNYHQLLKNILENGESREDRTGVGTISLFTPDQLVFDLEESFPLLTTKFVPLRIVFEELMWFIRGQTDNNILKEKNIHIWDGNSTKEYLKKINLENYYPEGELGPIYGAQWRNFGGVHDLSQKNHIATPENGGFDQLQYIIDEIKSNPTSRRLLVSAYNPNVLDKIALPSCHYTFQFYVRKERYLDCKMSMRSTDCFLGLPFNIASYSLLTIMIAKITNLIPGKVYISFGDCHIYKNHLEQVRKQLERTPRKFPTLKVLQVPEKIEDFTFEMFELENYYPHPTIKGEMAV